ncbi:hypothetical protein KDC22_08615 [Paenibacillus tritici]|uniref:hypothetical protein n=1 Tax=Paenibacillus tritici TaxID=1873425 RepID=UPI001BA54933|nr:hypothetical protein [Paenibacillus tritici]QUL56540.1 hypothetical protein KDC22_08615 [Paenibacillus tritici]
MSAVRGGLDWILASRTDGGYSIEMTVIEGPEGNFGTVGAAATAFVTGFQPRRAVSMKKSGDNSGRKSKYSL